MQCVVLAGGVTARSASVPQKIPTVLLEVGGQALLHWQLQQLARTGVSEVLCALGPMGEQVEGWLSAHPLPQGLLVKTVREPSPSGSAGALKLLEPKLQEKFLLAPGERFLPIDFGAFFRRFDASGARASMAVVQNQGRWAPGNVVWRDGAIALYDATRTSAADADFNAIDAGLLGLSRSLVKGRVPPRGELAPVLGAIAGEGALSGVEVFRRFFDVGSQQGLADLETWLSQPLREVLVLLERDALLETAPESAEEVRLLPGVAEAMSRLSTVGATLVLVGNAATGVDPEVERAALEATRFEILRQAQSAGARIQGAYLCWHRSEEVCNCRLPQPLLLQEARAKFWAAEVWSVGDQRAVDAGRAAGVKTAWLGDGAPIDGADFTGPDLASWLKWRLETR